MLQGCASRILCLSLLTTVGFAGCLKKKPQPTEAHIKDASAKSEDELSAMEIWRLVGEFGKAAVVAKKDQIKDSFFTLANNLHNRNRLRAVLRFVIAQADGRFDVAAIQAMSDQEKEDLVNQMETAISAELANRDVTNGYQSWDSVSSQIKAQLGNEHAAIGSEKFYKQLADLIGGRWVSYTKAKVLIDGPASFAERDRLITNATKSIWIMSWAIYDDATGKRAVEMLKAAKARNVDVKVMVDGQIAQQKFADESAKALQDAGIQVVFWQHPDYEFHGMHRKMMVVDHEAVIIGGMNFGDEYSHFNVTDPKKKWRDTDALFQGEIAKEASYMFASTWNYIVRANRGLGVEPLAVPSRPQAANSPPRAMLVDHEPTQNTKDPILLATLKIFLGARQKLDIGNAYYIAIKPTQETLLQVASRVPTRLHTNSSDSVDVPTLIRPIYRGLGPLHDAGVKIALQKGTTVHNKLLVADNRIGWIGSYNLHPRSYRYETESVMLFDDPELAKQFHQMFDADFAAASTVTNKSEVALPDASLSDFAESFFFDQL
jgi:cardiolipin synthase